MTDSKRASSSKVATPKTSGAKDMADMGDVLLRAIGCRMRVTVAPLNVTYEGYLFTADPFTNMICINVRPAGPNPTSDYWKLPADLHIIPVCHILNFTVLELGPRATSFEDVVPSIGPLDIKALEAREEATIKRLKEEEARAKAGVTAEGRDVYNAMSKTLPCRWHETSIIVNEAVVIKAPYTLNDCQAPKDKQSALAHVKKILSGHLDRKKPNAAAQSNANRPAVATPIAPRKGG